MCKKLLVIAMVIGLGIANFVSSYAEVKENKEKKYRDIRELINLVPTSKIYKTIMDSMLNYYKNSVNIPRESLEKIINKVSNKIEASMQDELSKIIIPIYDKYFTHDEIKELLNFYSSTVGKKYNSVLPEFMRDLTVGMLPWSSKIQKEIAEELTKELKTESYIKEAEKILIQTEKLIEKTKEAVTRGNFASIRSAVSIYYGDKEGEWPKSIDVLVPKYLKEILKEEITGSNKVVDKFDGTGGWCYNPKTGEVILNLEGKDSKGVEYRKY